MSKEYIIRAVIGELSCTLVLSKEVASELEWQKDEDLKCIIRNLELIISKMRDLKSRALLVSVFISAERFLTYMLYNKDAEY
jgi:hypothetical protein